MLSALFGSLEVHKFLTVESTAVVGSITARSTAMMVGSQTAGFTSVNRSPTRSESAVVVRTAGFNANSKFVEEPLQGMLNSKSDQWAIKFR